MIETDKWRKTIVEIWTPEPLTCNQKQTVIKAVNDALIEMLKQPRIPFIVQAEMPEKPRRSKKR